MCYNLKKREMLDIFCAKSVGMAYSDNLHRGKYSSRLYKQFIPNRLCFPNLNYKFKELSFVRYVKEDM